MDNARKKDYANQAVNNLTSRNQAAMMRESSPLAGREGITAPYTPQRAQSLREPAQLGANQGHTLGNTGQSPIPTPTFGSTGQSPMGAPALQRELSKAQNFDSNKVEELNRELNRYRAGKQSIERRAIAAERWWKMRNSFEVERLTDGKKDGGFKAQSAWLHNVITSKHADALEAYPSPNILPREESDKTEAWALSKIVPVVLRQNDFEATYDHNIWQKLKTGTAVYKVVWDREKLNGLGDIAIMRVDMLNVFWEPGVNDIQESKYVFHTSLENKDELEAKYPELLSGKNISSAFVPSKFPGDDSRDTSDKTIVVDCYYKKRGKLHYVKYVGDVILYATENDPERAEKGLYEHGRYPFVFDVLFPIEDSPAGYGYVDICANPQIRIDLMNTAILKNSIAGATPRYFTRNDGQINEEEFLDLNNPIVHVNSLAEGSLQVIDYKPLHGNYISMLDSTINELRETSGNTETSTGSSKNGVTAASALAALQEASGKTSRASTKATYRAYSDIVYMVIELIRQYYDLPRQFRITGDMGVQKYINFSNQGMKPQHQGMLGGVDMGYRTPIYDIEVAPEKHTSYTRLAQNELAVQLYSLGFFNPQLADQALVCLNMMDFDGKDELIQRLSQNGTMYQQLQLYKAMAATLAAKHEPEMVGGLLGVDNPTKAGEENTDGKRKNTDAPELDKNTKKEVKNVENARERAQSVAQP